MLEGIGLLQLGAQRMRYLSQRQTLISQNIANADTPGYHSKDLTPFAPAVPVPSGSGSTAGALQMARTSASHFGFGATGTGGAKLASRVTSYDDKLDANNVSIEEQEMKANDVASSYDLATAAYTKTISLLKTSLGGG